MIEKNSKENVADGSETDGEAVEIVAIGPDLLASLNAGHVAAAAELADMAAKDTAAQIEADANQFETERLQRAADAAQIAADTLRLQIEAELAAKEKAKAVEQLLGDTDFTPVPDAVSRGQFVVALDRVGALAPLMVAMDRSLPNVDGGETFPAAWVGAQDVRLNAKLTTVVAVVLGLSQVQLENLFRAAARIEA